MREQNTNIRADLNEYKGIGVMHSDGRITLYHAPKTRSSATLLLLEELGAPYDPRVLNMKAGDNMTTSMACVVLRSSREPG